MIKGGDNVEKKIGIYCIENIINGKKYIGQSVNLKDRLYGHKTKLKHNKHKNRHLQFAVNKYGIKNFTFNIIEECDAAHLDERERYYISFYKSDNEDFGYNIEPGGSRDIKTMSEQTRLKISESLKGRIFTEEHRAKIGKANHERVITEETKNKMSVNHADVNGKNNPRATVPLYCPELHELFWGAKDVENKYGISRSHVTSCANGHLKHAGKHPITGEPLSWIKVESKNC